ncbi:hypothetical protein EON83_11040 [bacterium]|nr:MAG: hypothetical protein EON83_11040 [bacterium]
MATQTLEPGAPIVSSTAPRTAPAAPQLVTLQCSERFDHVWGTQMASSVGPINISEDGSVEVPVDVAAKLLARRPIPDPESGNEKGEPMFTASDDELTAIADFQLNQSGQTSETVSSINRKLVYIECPGMAQERMNVRDPETDKQVGVDFDEDGMAVVTVYIYEKMRGGFGGDGTSKAEDAAPIYLRGTVGEDGVSGYFDDDAPSSGPVGSARVDNGDIIGVEVEDTDHSRPEPQTTPSARLIEEFNKSSETATTSETPTDTETNTAQISTNTTDKPSTPAPPTFIDSLKKAIGAPATAALAAEGFDTEAEIRAASKEALQKVKGIGDSKTFIKLWAAIHPDEANASNTAPTDTTTTTNTAS